MRFFVRVRAWLARGYFIPGGTSQSGRVVRLRRSMSHVAGPGHMLTSDWVPSSPVGAPWGPVGLRTFVVHPYESMESSIRARRGPSGHIGRSRGSVRTPIWHDMPCQGLPDHSTVSYPCMTKIPTLRGSLVAQEAVRSLVGTQWGCGGRLAPTSDPLPIGALWFGAAMRHSLLSAKLGLCNFEFLLSCQVLQLLRPNFLTNDQDEADFPIGFS